MHRIHQKERCPEQEIYFQSDLCPTKTQCRFTLALALELALGRSSSWWVLLVFPSYTGLYGATNYVQCGQIDIVNLCSCNY